MTLDLLSLDENAPPIKKISVTMLYLLSDRFEPIYHEIFPIINVFITRLGS